MARLLAGDAAQVVQDGPELTAFVKRCLDEPAFADSLGEHARRVVAAQLGATARTADLLDGLLSNSAEAREHRRPAA